MSIKQVMDGWIFLCNNKYVTVSTNMCRKIEGVDERKILEYILTKIGVNTRNWIVLTQDRDYWGALVNTVLNQILIPENATQNNGKTSGPSGILFYIRW